MITNLLARWGYIVIDTDTIARKLAGETIRVWGSDLYRLSELDGTQELQRKYVEIAMATGLPGNIAFQVADRAWRYVRQAQRVPVVDRTGFHFWR